MTFEAGHIVPLGSEIGRQFSSFFCGTNVLSSGPQNSRQDAKEAKTQRRQRRKGGKDAKVNRLAFFGEPDYFAAERL